MTQGTKKPIQYDDLFNVLRNIQGRDERFYFFLSACENGNLQICQLCLEVWGDINIRESRYMYTLLNKLVENGTFTAEVGNWLVDNGADINMAFSKSNLSIACKKGNFQAAKFFIDKGVQIYQYKKDLVPSTLYKAVFGGNCDIVKLLLDLGVDLEDDVTITSNPFITSIIDKLPNIVELFLQRGANPNIYFDGRTALHLAVLKRSFEITQLLLKYNANLNARLTGNSILFRNNVALTSMDLAILNKDISMQKLLLSFGGSASSKDEKMQALSQCRKNEKALLVLRNLLES